MKVFEYEDNQSGEKRKVIAFKHQLKGNEGVWSDTSIIEVFDLEKYEVSDNTCGTVDVIYQNPKGEYRKMSDEYPKGVAFRFREVNHKGEYTMGKIYYPILYKVQDIALFFHEGEHSWQEARQGKMTEEEIRSRSNLLDRLSYSLGSGEELSFYDHLVIHKMALEENEAWELARKKMEEWQKGGFDLYGGLGDEDIADCAYANLCGYQKAYERLDTNVKFITTAKTVSSSPAVKNSQ